MRGALSTLIIVLWLGLDGRPALCQTLLGEYGVLEAVYEPELVWNYEVHGDKPGAAPNNHPVALAASTLRPKVMLSPHSKALLQWNSRIQLTEQMGDTLYFARPNGLIHLAYEGNVRKSHRVQDSLFVFPNEMRESYLENLLDFWPGRLERYAHESSRVVGLYRLSVGEETVLAAIISHDHVTKKEGDYPIAIAVYSENLDMLDIIRIPKSRWMRFGNEPFRSNGRAVFWKSGQMAMQGFRINRRPISTENRVTGPAF